MTFQEVFPTRMRFGSALASGLGIAWFVAGLLALAIGGTILKGFSSLLTIAWALYFLHRLSMRFTTTVYCSDGLLTIVRRSVIPGMSPPVECHRLGKHPNLEISSTATWWHPAPAPLIAGDPTQHFTDLAVSEAGTSKLSRIIVSRDRIPPEAMLSRREELRMLLQREASPPSGDDFEMGFGL